MFIFLATSDLTMFFFLINRFHFTLTLVLFLFYEMTLKSKCIDNNNELWFIYLLLINLKVLRTFTFTGKQVIKY